MSTIDKEKLVFAAKLAVLVVIVIVLVLYAYVRSHQTKVYMVGLEKMLSEDVKQTWDKLKNRFGSRAENFHVNQIPAIITVKDGKIVSYGRPDSSDFVENFVKNALK